MKGVWCNNATTAHLTYTQVINCACCCGDDINAEKYNQKACNGFFKHGIYINKNRWSRKKSEKLPFYESVFIMDSCYILGRQYTTLS